MFHSTYRSSYSTEGGGSDFQYLAQRMPVPTKGFGTSLALFGDLIMHKVEPDEVKPLMSFLVELLGCMSGQDNPNDFSILGIN